MDGWIIHSSDGGHGPTLVPALDLRKPALLLLYTQTSEDILGMTLPHDNLITRRDGKVPWREHISFLDLSTLVRWLW